MKQSFGSLLGMNGCIHQRVKKKDCAEVSENTKSLEKRMVDKHKRKYNTVEYKCNENALV